MKKRFLSAALTVAMAVSMTACSSKPAETAPATEAAAPAETEAAGEETEAKEAAADTGDKEPVSYTHLLAFRAIFNRSPIVISHLLKDKF